MHKLPQFFKTEKKEKMWVPVPPEMPESLRSCGTDIPVCPSVCFNPTQSYDHRCHQRLPADQLHGMREIFCKHRDQRARYRQVPQRHPFKCSARRPSCRCFPDEPRRDPIRPLFETDCALVPSSGAHFRAPGERRLISSILLPLHFVHSRSPVLLLASGDRRLLLFLLCDALLHSACPDPVGTSLRYILFSLPT